MLLYVTLGTNDIDQARHFYDVVLPVLGYRRQRYSEEEIGYAADGDIRCRLWIVTPFNRRRASDGNGTMIALAAETRADVDAFYRAAISAGGVSEGEPGCAPSTPISMRLTCAIPMATS